MNNEWPRNMLQLLSVAAFITFILFGGIAFTTAIILLLIYGNIYWQILCISYLIFFYIDFETPSKGGRGVGCEWVRNWRVWKHVVDYFPVDLVKTADFPADRNYLIAATPHGILCFGALINGMTNYSKWRRLFPQIRSKVLTLSINMLFPIFREAILSWGLSDSSAENINTLLSQSNDPIDPSNRDGFTSNAAIVMFGGAREAFLSAPNTYKVFLNSRKGFIRMAIQNGASLVPAVAFGETNVYDTTQSKTDSFVRKIQEIIKKYTTLAPVAFNGRGIFQQSFGLIPRRRPITLVVGAPIHINRNPESKDVSETEINDMHATFRKKLIELFETHKSKYIENHEKIHLEIA
ncbi:2-acylglycerol O-acyltransferase 2-A-like [Contarinia nasturtii]|uniref:2-acylglycerol O-acyltransferase 2-A-like n=1 Tax=Contarinia nasturtii TaxID=265458 RepID=UPI0012D3DB41|nr:2-acylglycerol O-acyltransferase 2-A-like [Contarinia nasturtii]